MNEPYTPGPWVIQRKDSAVGGYIERNIVFPGGNIGNKHVEPFVIATINGIYYGPHDNEPDANAALIASAPALQAENEALRKALRGLVEASGLNNVRLLVEARENALNLLNPQPKATP